tara:strand:- start:652 stop:1233 length:582 start_codon:yes stop_codon:yes gene_type:complete
LKKKIYLSIFILLIIFIILNYQKFDNSEKNTNKNQMKDQNSINESPNNIIKNLKYNVNFENNTSYTITASESELTYEGANEIVIMKNVQAIFVNKENEVLKINSKNAKYNNFSYNTIFENEVKIEYLDNIIKSEKLILDFEESVVVISNNIIYEGLKGVGKADIIKINLLTKNIEISMNNSNKKIEIIPKSKL